MHPAPEGTHGAPECVFKIADSTWGIGDFAIWEDQSFPGCFGGAVYAYYWPVEVWGGNRGNLFGNAAWIVQGPSCNNLLGPGWVLLRSFN